MQPFSQRVNFYQEQFKKPVVLLPLKTMLLGWAALLLLMLGLAVHDARFTSSVREQVQQIKASHGQMQTSVEKMQQEVDAQMLDPALVQSEKQLQQRLMGKRDFLRALSQSDSGSVVRHSDVLEALASVDAGPVWLTRIQTRSPGPQLQLEGMSSRANAIPQYLHQLKLEPAFADMGFRVFDVERHEADGDWLRFYLSTRHDERIAD